MMNGRVHSFIEKVQASSSRPKIQKKNRLSVYLVCTWITFEVSPMLF